MLPVLSARVAIFSSDSALCTRVLDSLQLDRAPLGSGGFRDQIASSPNNSDVAVIDWNMSGALQRCQDLSSVDKPRVVMIGVPDNAEAAVEALRAGAFGVVFNSQPLLDVNRAVEVVSRGEVFAPRHVVLAAWRKARAETAPRPQLKTPDGSKRLSYREREVLQYAAAGLSNRELASRLLISEATVKVHLTHIFQKLGVRGRAALAAIYFGINQT